MSCAALCHNKPFIKMLEPVTECIEGCQCGVSIECPNLNCKERCAPYGYEPLVNRTTDCIINCGCKGPSGATQCPQVNCQSVCGGPSLRNFVDPGTKCIYACQCISGITCTNINCNQKCYPHTYEPVLDRSINCISDCGCNGHDTETGVIPQCPQVDCRIVCGGPFLNTIVDDDSNCIYACQCFSGVAGVACYDFKCPQLCAPFVSEPVYDGTNNCISNCGCKQDTETGVIPQCPQVDCQIVCGGPFLNTIVDDVTHCIYACQCFSGVACFDFKCPQLCAPFASEPVYNWTTGCISNCGCKQNTETGVVIQCPRVDCRIVCGGPFLNTIVDDDSNCIYACQCFSGVAGVACYDFKCPQLCAPFVSEPVYDGTNNCISNCGCKASDQGQSPDQGCPQVNCVDFCNGAFQRNIEHHKTKCIYACECTYGVICLNYNCAQTCFPHEYEPISDEETGCFSSCGCKIPDQGNTVTERPPQCIGIDCSQRCPGRYFSEILDNKNECIIDCACNGLLPVQCPQTDCIRLCGGRQSFAFAIYDQPSMCVAACQCLERTVCPELYCPDICGPGVTFTRAVYPQPRCAFGCRCSHSQQRCPEQVNCFLRCNSILDVIEIKDPITGCVTGCQCPGQGGSKPDQNQTPAPPMICKEEINCNKICHHSNFSPIMDANNCIYDCDCRCAPIDCETTCGSSYFSITTNRVTKCEECVCQQVSPSCIDRNCKSECFGRRSYQEVRDYRGCIIRCDCSDMCSNTDCFDICKHYNFIPERNLVTGCIDGCNCNNVHVVTCKKLDCDQSCGSRKFSKELDRNGCESKCICGDCKRQINCGPRCPGRYVTERRDDFGCITDCICGSLLPQLCENKINCLDDCGVLKFREIKDTNNCITSCECLQVLPTPAPPCQNEVDCRAGCGGWTFRAIRDNQNCVRDCICLNTITSCTPLDCTTTCLGRPSQVKRNELGCPIECMCECRQNCFGVCDSGSFAVNRDSEGCVLCFCQPSYCERLDCLAACRGGSYRLKQNGRKCYSCTCEKGKNSLL